MGEPSYQKGDRVSVTAFGFHGWQKGVGATVMAVYDDGTLGLSVDEHGPYLTTSKKIRDVVPATARTERKARGMEPEPQTTVRLNKHTDAVEAALSAGEGGFRVLSMHLGTDGRDRVVIATPFVYPDGDHMMLYMEPPVEEGAGWRVSDVATTVGHHDILHDLGDDGLLTDMQMERVRRLLAAYGPWVEDVGFDDGELHVTVAADQIGFGIAHFAQLQIRLSAICMSGD